MDQYWAVSRGMPKGMVACEDGRSAQLQADRQINRGRVGTHWTTSGIHAGGCKEQRSGRKEETEKVGDGETT